MSFYMVPSVSYQTQQKMKKANDKKKQKKKTRKPTDKSGDSSRLTSTSSSTNNSIHSPSIHEEIMEDGSSIHQKEGASDVASNTVSISGSSSSKTSNTDDFNNTLNAKLNKLIRTDSGMSLSNVAYKNVVESPKSTVQNNSYFETRPGMTTVDSFSSANNNNDDTSSLQPLEITDMTRNSTSTSSSLPKHRYRRNSSISLSSVQTTTSTNKERNKSNIASEVMSNSSENSNQANNNDTSSADYSKSSKIFKPSYSMTQNETYPEFKTMLDLSQLNSIESISKHFYSPTFQIFRFKNFLDIVKGQHVNDPINFANIRYNSISKFLLRHNDFANVAIEDVVKGFDIKRFEGALSCSLIAMRRVIRKLIRLDSNKDLNRTEIYSCEELVQLNFTNYLRFILSLPQKILVASPESLNEDQLVHQKFKILFTRFIRALHTFQKEGSGDDLATSTNAVAYLFQLITKVSYDFILLEKYHINILSKLSNNSLLDNRISLKLFAKYQKSLGSPKIFESPKVLFFNAYFSAQYSWYLSVTVPFIKVIETNVFNENASNIRDFKKYQKIESATNKTTFKESDLLLFKNYYNKLNLENFAKFRDMTDEQLVELQKATEPFELHGNDHANNSTSAESLASIGSHKPQNFEYYGDSLSTFASETFDVVHSRDLLFQLTNANYYTVISEFHRVLKPGGILDIPIILPGSETIKGENTTVGFPKFTKTTGSELADHYDMIPNFAEVLLSTIISVFGEGNVKFSVILLNSSDEIINFLARDIGLHVAEMIGTTDQFCKQFEAEQGKVSQDVHFFFPIQATKV